jgi:hypothetical protein
MGDGAWVNMVNMVNMVGSACVPLVVRRYTVVLGSQWCEVR